MSGVYSLAPGARVHDLIAAAGGALANADLTRVNLAAVVNDGESVYVPLYGEVVPTERGGKIDLNTATAEQLHQALGITLTTARKIVAYPTAHGDFTAVSPSSCSCPSAVAATITSKTL
jgi:competence protein ComEA